MKFVGCNMNKTSSSSESLYCTR